jgi:molybdopterin-containing oxidoreductase family molybdopterin binding subunit
MFQVQGARRAGFVLACTIQGETTTNKEEKMPDESTSTRTASLSRRSFVATLAAAAGAAALAGSFAGCAPKPEDGTTGNLAVPEEQTFQGLCRGNCGGGCRMNVHVRDGKIVKTSVIEADDPIDTRICAKGLTHTQRIYAPERIQYPMRRKEGTPRGGGEWERITWDEAIQEITDKWKNYIDEFGPASVTFSYCCGTYGKNYFVYFRLANCFGGTTFVELADSAALDIANRMVGNYSAPYLAGNDCQDVLNAKNIIFWGSNATSAGMQRMPYIFEAVKRGAKIITIDPIYNDIAAKSDQWIPIRPATDGALAFAIMRIIVDEDKVAEDYLRKNTVAPFLVIDGRNRFLRMSDLGVEPKDTGTFDAYGQPVMDDPFVVVDGNGEQGKLGDITAPTIKGSYNIEGNVVTTAWQLMLDRIAEWTPERASELCDIPVETIYNLAHTILDGPTHFNLGFGNDHWGNGASITHAQFIMVMMSGQWGIPGGGIGGSQGGSNSAPMPEMNMAGVLYGPNAVYTGLTASLQDLPEIMDTGMYGENPLPVKSLFIYCANTLATNTDRSLLVKAIDKIDLIITADWLMTDTTRYSDIILPVPHWFEFATFSTTPTSYADVSEKLVEPLYECKEDVEITKMIGLAMGWEDMDLTTDQYHQLYFDSDLAREKGLTWDYLKEVKHYLAAPVPYIYGNVDYETTFFTSTGRAEFYFEDVKPHYDRGQTLDKNLLALPAFELPLEAWPVTIGEYEKNPLADKYPLTLITHRDKLKVHTTFTLSPWLLEIQPEPTLEINAVDAEQRGISEDDYARVFNDRGSAVFRAHIDASMRPGTMWTEHTWMQEQYVDGHYSTLTSIATRQHMPSNHWFDTLCEVEKYQEGGN